MSYSSVYERGNFIWQKDMIQDIVYFVLANLREQMDIIHTVGRRDKEKEIR